MAAPLAPFHQAVAVQHRVDRALGRGVGQGIGPYQLFADLGRPPARMVALDAQDRSLHLVRQSVGMTIGPAAAIVQSLQTAVAIAIEDLVSGDPGDTKLPAHDRHLLTLQQPGYKSNTFIHRLTLSPRHSKVSLKCTIV